MNGYGKEVGRFIPRDTAVSYLTDSLTGILKGNGDISQSKEERLKSKYDSDSGADPCGFYHHTEC